MPYYSRKVRGFGPTHNCYKVSNKHTKKVFAKCTSKINAAKQMRLLRALQYNKQFTTYSNRKTIKQKQKKNTKKRRKNHGRK